MVGVASMLLVVTIPRGDVVWPYWGVSAPKAGQPIAPATPVAPASAKRSS